MRTSCLHFVLQPMRYLMLALVRPFNRNRTQQRHPCAPPHRPNIFTMLHPSCSYYGADPYRPTTFKIFSYSQHTISFLKKQLVITTNFNLKICKKSHVTFCHCRHIYRVVSAQDRGRHDYRQGEFAHLRILDGFFAQGQVKLR